jgi:hypothetical protein
MKSSIAFSSFALRRELFKAPYVLNKVKRKEIKRDSKIKEREKERERKERNKERHRK